MLKQNKSIRLLLLFFLILLITSCTKKTIDEDIAGSISIDERSKYQETFDELRIGKIFNYNFHWHKANESWVNVWLEGYRNGHLIEPNPLNGMKYGMSPNEEVKGKLGFGLIDSNEEPLVFYYSNETHINPSMVQENLFLNEGISLWDYGINDEIQLKYGEEKILAVYRENKNTIRTGYDYQDDEVIEDVIKNNETVLFFKIKIEKAK
jgi:hypothetical protein